MVRTAGGDPRPGVATFALGPRHRADLPRLAGGQQAGHHRVGAQPDTRGQRLARDYETLPDISTAMIHTAMIDNLTRRLTNETTPTGETLEDHTTRKIPESDAL